MPVLDKIQEINDIIKAVALFIQSDEEIKRLYLPAQQPCPFAWVGKEVYICTEIFG